jgi:hypothetical protein
MKKFYSSYLDHRELKEQGYNKDIIKKQFNELDDVMADYLLNSDAYPEFNTMQTERLLSDAGYDLNLNNWASITCSYLPFVHYLYLPDGWII